MRKHTTDFPEHLFHPWHGGSDFLHCCTDWKSNRLQSCVDYVPWSTESPAGSESLYAWMPTCNPAESSKPCFLVRQSLIISGHSKAFRNILNCVLWAGFQYQVFCASDFPVWLLEQGDGVTTWAIKDLPPLLFSATMVFCWTPGYFLILSPSCAILRVQYTKQGQDTEPKSAMRLCRQFDFRTHPGVFSVLFRQHSPIPSLDTVGRTAWPGTVPSRDMVICFWLGERWNPQPYSGPVLTVNQAAAHELSCVKMPVWGLLSAL